ncbi:hypothetical protein G9A89_002183 [Geosiphon pyriformis]|nr:hypothetical protein G9A89_002183 [Geosiphon pyriformis]
MNNINSNSHLVSSKKSPLALSNQLSNKSFQSFTTLMSNEDFLSDLALSQMLLSYLSLSETKVSDDEFDEDTLYFKDFDGVYCEEQKISTETNLSNYHDEICPDFSISASYSDIEEYSTTDESLSTLGGSMSTSNCFNYNTATCFNFFKSPYPKNPTFISIEEWKRNAQDDTAELTTNFQMTNEKRSRISQIMEYQRIIREMEQENEDRLIEEEVGGWWIDHDVEESDYDE